MLVRVVLGRTGDCVEVFREGLLLAWKGIAAHSIVQILSTHPKIFSPVRSSCVVFWEQVGKQPLSAGRSVWWALVSTS